VIVVDSNVIAYCWIGSQHTSVAHRVRVADADWRVPFLWRSELRNILAGHVRRGSLSEVQVARLMRHIEDELHGSEHLVASDAVFKVVGETRLSAYDAEFVALAQVLGVPLVTEDKAILKAFPAFAVSMEGFLSSLKTDD
jgi:predicted nucleic acid-binding protein